MIRSGQANWFWDRPDGKYFRLGDCAVATQFGCCSVKAALEDRVEEWARLCSSQTLFTNTGGPLFFIHQLYSANASLGWMWEKAADKEITVEQLEKL